VKKARVSEKHGLAMKNMSRRNSSVKKLSPTEPYMNVSIVIDIPWNISATRIEKTIREKHGFRTRLVNPYRVEAYQQTLLQDSTTFLREVENLLKDMPREVIICLDHWITVRETKCPCISVFHRNNCIIDLNDVKIYIYCNTRKNYLSIRFLRKIYSKNIDPNQLTPSTYVYCGVAEDVINSLGEISRNVELFNTFRDKIISREHAT